MTDQFRQGDVLLQRITAIPPTAKPARSTRDRVVLARGEATGHAHAVPASRAELFQERGSGRAFLAVGTQDALLQHEEHAPIRLPSGCYEVIRQREYTPTAIRLRRD